MHTSPLIKSFLPLVLSTACLVSASSTPSVKIDNGVLQGGRCRNATGAVFFKSIPYAQSPVGNLRFAPPQSYDQEYPGGTRNAIVPAPACIQFGGTFIEHTPTSEDCLFVDIWAPANVTPSSNLPVRVWLYGGSDLAGGISDPLYDGCNVPQTDTIMVSVNYRLGPLGFLALPGTDVKGNQAIQDIKMALEWVQANIAAFGGNPKKVVLHGQSAGAINTFTIATQDDAPRLMSAAIMQSGGGRTLQYPKSMMQLGESFAESLNCSVEDISCVQSKTVQQMNATFKSLPLLRGRVLPSVFADNVTSPDFLPYFDGKIVTRQPSESGIQVPSILGSNLMEGNIFAFFQFATTGGPASATPKDYQAFLHESFGTFAPTVEKQYPLSAFNSTPYPSFYAIAKVLGDSSYFCPTYRGLNVAAHKNVPVWTYLFAHNPTCPWFPFITGETLKLLGPTHTSEIAYVLGNTQSLPLPNGDCNLTPSEVNISNFMLDAWSSMASNQKPTTHADQWPMYGGPETSLGINFVNSTTIGKVDYSRCKIWDDLNDLLLANVTSMMSGNDSMMGGSGSTSTGGAGTSGSGSGSSPSASSNSSPIAFANRSADLAGSFQWLGGCLAAFIGLALL